MKPILKDISIRPHPTSVSGFFNPRALAAFALCSAGVVLGMFSVAATPLSELESSPSRKPAEVARRNATATPTLFQPSQLPVGSLFAARALSSRMPLPPGIASSPRDPLGAPFPVSRQVDSQSSGPTAGSPNIAPASAATGSWSIITSPNGGFAPTSLSAVTCVMASDCWALGRTEIGQTYANTTMMHWDGSSWQVVPSPSVEKKTNGLVAITCLSSTSCWAVGYTITFQTVEVKTLTLHWDGTSWQIVPSPNIGTGFNALYGVACASELDCWAVGFENGGNLAQTLIERWDGTSWTIHNSPNVGSQHNVLNGVTCVAASDCRAVGYTGVAGAKSALVARWDGTAWTASALTNQLASQEDILSSVTCNSTLDCWAVGDSYNGNVHQTLIEQWNGTSWASAVAPNGGVDNYLSHVACASASDCWAVGHLNNAAADPQLFDQDLILHWNGSVWLLSAAPLDEGTTYANDLAGVACASGSECWAVGSIQPAGSGRALIVRWDGTSWTSVAAPDVHAKPSNFLGGVTCVSRSNCWAVGFDFYGTIARGLTLHWDGTAWAIKESPSTAVDRSNYLSDVTCISASDCWAVGQSSDTLDRARQALAMHWDGVSWSISTPSPVDTSQVAETALESVACASTSDCWSVGFASVTQGPRLVPWIQHWNGQAWASFPAPPNQYVQTADHILYHVACTSTSDCWAVGDQGTVPVQTLIDHWYGTSWSEVVSPNSATDQDNILSAVTCVSATDCWAVGSSANQALIERWDGISWSIVASPQTGEILNAVTCLSASDCWAAGPYYTPNPRAQTLLVHWDGTSWSKVASPNTSAAQSNFLTGIACASSSDCWAVGQYWQGGSPQTLTLHYALSPPLSAVVSRMTHGSITMPPFFDIDLPLTGTRGVECRSSASLGVGNYTMVFTFTNNLTSVASATVTGHDPTNGTGDMSGNVVVGPNPSLGLGANQCTVNLTNVSNAQYITVTLTDVVDSAHNAGNVSGTMGVLIGDVTGNGVVTNTDVSAVKGQVNPTTPVTQANFREDVTINGFVTNTDVSVVKGQVNPTGGLPSPP